MRERLSRTARWLIAASIPCALVAQTVPPSPAELIARAIAAQKAESDRGWKYTYREDHTDWQLDKNGNRSEPSAKTWDHIMLEGSEYRKLVLIDGRPLDAKTQKKVDDDLEKARDTRKKNGLLNKTVSLGSLEYLPRLFDNKVTGEETVAGRKTWRMESEPKSGVKPANKQEEEAIGSRRVNWFDEETGMSIREVNDFIRATNGFQPGSYVETELTQIGDDWLPGVFIIRADIKFIAVAHARMESEQRYYDHKRFTVDASFSPE